jgi:hypothetical protein
MNTKRIFKKEFFITLFIKQNKWHRFGILIHTLAVAFHIFKAKKYSMLGAAFLHDVGKPYVAYQNDEDKIIGEYSFHNHEEASYHIIKNWKISEYTKKLVRYHYLIRGMQKAKEKNHLGRYHRMKRVFENLDEDFQKELELFMYFDDLGKKSF